MADLLTQASEPAPVKATTANVTLALRERYSAPEFSFFEEVGDSGSSSSVYADGVAINMWASRGYAITGFEVKVSRSDWLRELKQPEKSEPILTKCDFWYLVAPDEVYLADEVPPSWGILSFKNGQLREKRKAPKLEPKPITRAFVAQMFRRGNGKEERDISNRIAKELAADRERMQKRVAEEVKSQTRMLREKGEKWDTFLKELGEPTWTNDEEVRRAVKAVMKAGVTGAHSGVADLLQRMQWATQRLEEAAAMFAPEVSETSGIRT